MYTKSLFSTAGGTLINQGTLMTKLSLRHKFLYRNSGFHPKNGRTNNAQLDGDGERDLASERQRIAGSGDGVLVRLRCRVVTDMVRPHPGWLR